MINANRAVTLFLLFLRAVTQAKQINAMLKTLFKKYIVDALGHMAMGLFCSLIMGLIIGQIAKIPGLGFLSFISG